MGTFSRSAVLAWSGDVLHGSGTVEAATGAFAVPASFPMLSGEAPGVTTPEELLAASHAVCYGIGLRGLIARSGGTAARITVQATITAEKGVRGIRIVSSHLHGVVEGLEGIDSPQLQEIARATEEGCTISIAIRPSVAITYEVVAADPAGELDPDEAA